MRGAKQNEMFEISHLSSVHVQLTIRGSGKYKQTSIKLLALQGEIYTFRNSGGDTVQKKLSHRSLQDLNLLKNISKIQTNNAPHFYLIQTGVG